MCVHIASSKIRVGMPHRTGGARSGEYSEDRKSCRIRCARRGRGQFPARLPRVSASCLSDQVACPIAPITWKRRLQSLFRGFDFGADAEEIFVASGWAADLE